MLGDFAEKIFHMLQWCFYLSNRIWTLCGNTIIMPILENIAENGNLRAFYSLDNILQFSVGGNYSLLWGKIIHGG